MITPSLTRQCKRIHQNIFDYLQNHQPPPTTTSCFQIRPLEHFQLFPHAEEDGSTKPKKQQVLSRICFRDMMFNDVSVSKYSISFSVSRKRQPEAQVCFTLQGHKCKLSMPPTRDNLSITLTLATSTMLIRAKNAQQFEYSTDSDKPRWNLKHSHNDLTVRLHYHPKKYAQQALQHYFALNNMYYAITDATPTHTLSKSSVNHPKESTTVENKSQQSPLDFPLPLDPHLDKPVRQLLAHLDQHPFKIVQSHRLHQGMQPYSPSRSISAFDILENQQLTRPDGNEETSLGQAKDEMKAGHQLQYEEIGNWQCNFRVPDENELVQTFHNKIDIINLQMKEKKHIITNIFQIRKFHQPDYSRQDQKMQCPITTCHIVLPKVDELRAHFYIKHRQLSRYGIKVDSKGRLTYSQKSVNFVLYLAMLYPNQVKKVIKRMKQKV